jgi:hypothetical protein
MIILIPLDSFIYIELINWVIYYYKEESMLVLISFFTNFKRFNHIHLRMAFTFWVRNGLNVINTPIASTTFKMKKTNWSPIYISTPIGKLLSLTNCQLRSLYESTILLKLIAYIFSSNKYKKHGVIQRAKQIIHKPINFISNGISTQKKKRRMGGEIMNSKSTCSLSLQKVGHTQDKWVTGCKGKYISSYKILVRETMEIVQLTL